ncbi:MAG: sigma-54-dependent Fis family transcriptional regulator [Candidatus Zixiibacteriota bacterium]|nr:MAG: sigma-54-dependent Fis family transcriptional regulator [candidate division Zixibacteria bacterium]
MKLSILLVDDETNIRRFLGEALRKRDHHVRSVGSAEEALEVLHADIVDLVILDINLPGMDGLAALGKIRELDDPPLVIMITAYGDVKSAVTAMKLGAHDYIAKPFEMTEMEIAVGKAAEVLSLRRQVDALKRQSTGAHFGAMIGQSPVMQQVYQAITKIARSPSATVLITGESGTGKELAARAIHELSRRSQGSFVALNCTAIQETLLESELFGYERGAFTDAKKSTRGLIEVASGGTLFLDEIGDMSMKLQAKLLRVLQERVIRRLGGQKDIPIDIRVIAATHRDLLQEIEAANFREDLYFRLAVVPLRMPRLVERREDVPLLVRAFVKEFCTVMGKPVMEVTSEAMAALVNYDWQGNIRELRNLIERLVILEEGPALTAGHLPPAFGGSPRAAVPAALQPTGSFRETKSRFVAQFEREYLTGLLIRHRGNVSRSAREAGLERSGFQRLMQRHGLKSQDFRAAAK